MDVLEKILEEIKQPINHTVMCGKRITTIDRVEEIIRSHMDEVPKCGECSRRKWYQKGYNDSKDINGRNNDELIDRKALKEEIGNLRMTITGMRNGKTMTAKALEEYKKSILRIIDEQQTENNDGWIPVEDGLPEVNKIVKVTVHSSEWISDFDSSWVPEEEKRRHPEAYKVYDGYIDESGKWVFIDEEFSENICEGSFGEDKGRIYDVVIAWQPLPESYRHKDIPAVKIQELLLRQ